MTLAALWQHTSLRKLSWQHIVHTCITTCQRYGILRRSSVLLWPTVQQHAWHHHGTGKALTGYHPYVVLQGLSALRRAATLVGDLNRALGQDAMDQLADRGVPVALALNLPLVEDFRHAGPKVHSSVSSRQLSSLVLSADPR